MDEAARNLDWQEWRAVGWLKRQKSPTADARLVDLIEELHSVENELRTCVVDADFETTDRADSLFAELGRQFGALLAAAPDNARQGGAAANAERPRETLDARSTQHGDTSVGSIDTISSPVQPLRLGDASGTTILIYPRFVAVLSPLKKPALADVRQLFVSTRPSHGSERGSATQAGELQVTLPDGLDRAYGFADLATCEAVADTFTRYIAALPELVEAAPAHPITTAAPEAKAPDPSRERLDQPSTAASGFDAAADRQMPCTDPEKILLLTTLEPDSATDPERGPPNVAQQCVTHGPTRATDEEAVDTATPELTEPEANVTTAGAGSDIPCDASVIDDEKPLEAGTCDPDEAPAASRVEEQVAVPQAATVPPSSSQPAISEGDEPIHDAAPQASQPAFGQLPREFRPHVKRDTTGAAATARNLNTVADLSVPRWTDRAAVAARQADSPTRDAGASAPVPASVHQRLGKPAQFSIAAALSLAIAVAATSPTMWREFNSPSAPPPTPVAAPSPTPPKQPVTSVTVADSPPAAPVSPVTTPPPAAPPPSTAQARPLTVREVVQLQRGLKALGYNPGPIDGVIGPQTIGAAGTFRESSGGQATGQIDSTLLEAVLYASADTGRPR